jgi:hypothetical protein
MPEARRAICSLLLAQHPCGHHCRLLQDLVVVMSLLNICIWVAMYNKGVHHTIVNGSENMCNTQTVNIGMDLLLKPSNVSEESYETDSSEIFDCFLKQFLLKHSHFL